MKSIPKEVIEAVRDRDGPHCRACLDYVEEPLPHHLFQRNYPGLLPDGTKPHGNIDRPDNIISVCFRCHDSIHTRNQNRLGDPFDRVTEFWKNRRDEHESDIGA